MELISRDDVIEAIKLYFTDIISNMPCDNKHNIIDTALAENYLEANKGLIGKIRELPTIEERKEGEWIDTGENLHKCSNCGQIIFSQTPYDLEMFHAYCGRCGAKMERRNE